MYRLTPVFLLLILMCGKPEEYPAAIKNYTLQQAYDSARWMMYVSNYQLKYFPICYNSLNKRKKFEAIKTGY